MTTAIDKVVEDALELPADARIGLVDRILASLNLPIRRKRPLVDPIKFCLKQGFKHYDRIEIFIDLKRERERLIPYCGITSGC